MLCEFTKKDLHILAWCTYRSYFDFTVSTVEARKDTILQKRTQTVILTVSGRCGLSRFIRSLWLCASQPTADEITVIWYWRTFFAMYQKLFTWYTSAGYDSRIPLNWVSVLSGVLQGSVLEPVMFICYINDMPNIVSSFIYIYADDTKICREMSDTPDCIKLQVDLNNFRDTWKW